MRRALAAAQALILPSFAEGLPVVLMESMAAGRPVIATAIAGVPELVTPEVGWLVPGGDMGALSGAVRALAASCPRPWPLWATPPAPALLPAMMSIPRPQSWPI